MKKIILLGSAVSLVIFLISCKEQASSPSQGSISSDSLVKRGNYLVSSMGCEDCHSPKKMGPTGPEPDLANAFSGSPAGMPLPPLSANPAWVMMSMDQTVAIGPWGTSYAANISSDSTGIGTWTEQQFSNALRKGKWKGLDGNRDLQPPMPWRSYQHLNDEDVKAIFAFLKSTKAVKNVVPAYQPPAGPPPVAAN